MQTSIDRCVTFVALLAIAFSFDATICGAQSQSPPAVDLTFSGPSFAKLSDRERQLLAEYAGHVQKLEERYGNMRMRATEEYWLAPYSKDGLFPPPPGSELALASVHDYVYRARDASYYRLDDRPHSIATGEGDLTVSFMTPTNPGQLILDPTTKQPIFTDWSDKGRSLTDKLNWCGFAVAPFSIGPNRIRTFLFSSREGFVVEKFSDGADADSVVTVLVSLVGDGWREQHRVRLDRRLSWAVIDSESESVTEDAPDQRSFDLQRCVYAEGGRAILKQVIYEGIVEDAKSRNRRFKWRRMITVDDAQESPAPLSDFDAKRVVDSVQAWSLAVLLKYIGVGSVFLLIGLVVARPDYMFRSLQRIRRVPRHFDRVFVAALFSAVFYSAAFAPIKLSFLAWVVPVLWTLLIRVPNPGTYEPRASESDCGMSPDPFSRSCSSWPAPLFYLKIWLAGAAFWLLCSGKILWECWLAGVSVFWTSALGTLFLLPLAVLWPLFIGLSRTAVWRLGVPVYVAAPIVWCGLEWVRKNYYLGGTPFGAIEHTQHHHLVMIQIADLCGEYGVSMFIVFVGSCIGGLLPLERTRFQSLRRPVGFRHSGWAILIVLAVCVSFVVVYGRRQLAHHRGLELKSSRQPRAKIALLQGSIDEGVNRSWLAQQERWSRYWSLSKSAGPGNNLVVWPELACHSEVLEFHPAFVPENWRNQSEGAVQEILAKTKLRFDEALIELAKLAQSNVLLGATTLLYDESGNLSRRNSAVLVDLKEGVGPRYDKVNLVQALEYNPLNRWMPGQLAQCSCFTKGEASPAFPIGACKETVVDEGQEDGAATALDESEPLWAAVNICYDSFFPHFVRGQVVGLTRSGQEPDVIINLADDMSIRFDAVQDMHLATHVFRAIENRKTCLVAATAGRAVWIDKTGRIVKQGELGESGHIVADIHRDPTMSYYRLWGDWLPIACACFSLLVAAFWTVSKCRSAPQPAISP